MLLHSLGPWTELEGTASSDVALLSVWPVLPLTEPDAQYAAEFVRHFLTQLLFIF